MFGDCCFVSISFKNSWLFIIIFYNKKKRIYGFCILIYYCDDLWFLKFYVIIVGINCFNVYILVLYIG